MKIELKGWAAVPVILLVVVFFGYRAFSARSAFAEEQGELLKSHLQGVYSSQQLGGLKSALDGGDADEIARGVKGIIALADIEFVDVKIKGTGDEVVARVQIEVAGETPPDGRGVRYFRLEHSVVSGWRVKREVTAWSYYSKLF